MREDRGTSTVEGAQAHAAALSEPEDRPSRSDVAGDVYRGPSAPEEQRRLVAEVVRLQEGQRSSIKQP